ncbi:MAG TPA: FAD-dependent oxidoreductase [Gemmatimonadaceae bacterium]|nr:FAD-dependent oxidoreductase [Gemmatimonadaceae bacterium]
MKDVRVLVIGGGFSGIAAAVALRARGASVTLLDERSTPGGRVRTDELEGFAVDTGAQLISTSFARTIALLSRNVPAGSRLARTALHAFPDSLHRVPGRDAYLQGGERFPLQFGSVRSLLSFGGLSAIEKLRLATHVLPMLTTNHAALDAGASKIPPAIDALSARGYMSTNVGTRAADVLVEPPLNGFYGVRGDEVSLAFYLMLGRYVTEGDMLAPTGGWSRALESVLHDIDYHAATKVLGLAIAEDGEVTARTEDGESRSADGVVIATGPRSAATLLAPILASGHPLPRWLSSVALRSTWTVALALDRAARRDAFGVFHDAPHARRVSACAVHGATMLGPPTDRDIVLAWPTPNAIADLQRESSSTLVAAMLPEIETLVPEVRGHVIRARVYRFDEGTPVTHPGFAVEREHGRALATELEARIVLAGDYLTAPLIEGAVASGNEAASLLESKLAPRD